MVAFSFSFSFISFSLSLSLSLSLSRSRSRSRSALPPSQINCYKLSENTTFCACACATLGAALQIARGGVAEPDGGGGGGDAAAAAHCGALAAAVKTQLVHWRPILKKMLSKQGSDALADEVRCCCGLLVPFRLSGKRPSVRIESRMLTFPFHRTTATFENIIS